MKTKQIILSLALALSALPAAAAEGIEKTPAFPGAEGFARYTTGGRGGAVYHVTSLADDGSEGTLRWACGKSGARTIVFDISGTIYLKSALALRGNNVTIAGQTAPGDGICIADYPFTIQADNVILRYLRFRVGNRHVDQHEGDGLGSMDHNNIIVDHCSVSWSVDECMSVYGGKNLTVQWCIVSQSMVNSGHSKGAHGYGGNWGGSGASYHHNLMIHHTSRTPRLGPRPGTQTDERMDLRCNLIYNWGGNGCYGGEGMNVNIVNNYYKPGPATLKRSAGIQKRIAAIGIRTSEYTHHNTDNPNAWDAMWHVWGTFYVTGNVNPRHADVTRDNWTYGIAQQIDRSGNDRTFNDSVEAHMKLAEPIPFYAVTTHTAETACQRVLDYAGCSLVRDTYDEVMISDAREGEATYTGTDPKTGKPMDGGFINSQDDCGGWPALTADPAATDTDGDGMPDTWETAHGLNPNDAADGKLADADGYTNLELYMNSLVADITARQNEGGSLEGLTEEREETVVPQTTTLSLSPATYAGSDPATCWLFEGGVSLTNNSGKGYATGGSNGFSGMKLSATAFTIHLPQGKQVRSITFHGASNYDDISYIKQLGSDKYGSGEYVFPAKESGSTEVGHHTFTPEQPWTDKIDFAIGGKQAIMAIDLALADASGISGVKADNAAGRAYTIGGLRLDKPRHGINIIDGRKVIVR